MFRVIVGTCAGLLGGCGPRIEEDPDWMLGTFSNVSDPSRTGRGDYSKLKLNAESTGLYTRLRCDGDDNEGAVLWELDRTAVRITSARDEYFLSPLETSSPFLIVLQRPASCRAEPEEILMKRFINSYEPDTFIDGVWYRTESCSGPAPEQPSCPDDGGECDGPPPCRVEWCEGFEPEPGD